MLQKVRIFPKNRFSDVTKFHVHATCFPHAARLKGTGVCGKKAKNFFDSLWFCSPPPPQSSKLAGAAANGFTRCGFFFAARRTYVGCGFNFEPGGGGGRTAALAKWLWLLFCRHRNKKEKQKQFVNNEEAKGVPSLYSSVKKVVPVFVFICFWVLRTPFGQRAPSTICSICNR